MAKIVFLDEFAACFFFFAVDPYPLWPPSRDKFPLVYNLLRGLCASPGGDHGSARAEISGSKQDCLLHHGGGRGRETPDRPSRGIQANVSVHTQILFYPFMSIYSKCWENLSISLICFIYKDGKFPFWGKWILETRLIFACLFWNKPPKMSK